MQQNADRIETAKAQPYFIQDNRAAVENALAQTPPTPSIYTEKYMAGFARQGLYVKDNMQMIEAMADNPFNQLDVLQLDREIRTLMTRFGFDEFDITGRMEVRTDGSVSLEWSDYNNRFTLSRKFFVDAEGRKVVDHHLFEISKELQGKGVSKRVFQSLYEQYKATGIERMEVFANIDIGGYTWARYGFCVESRDEVISAIRFSALTSKQEKRIMAIVDEHFKTSNEPDRKSVV